MAFDVITVGSATLDAFVHTDRSQLIKIMSASGEEDLIAYPSGAKLLISSLHFESGGGGTNTAVSLARLGLRVGYAGKIGKDHNAELILRFLRREHIAFLGTQCNSQSAFSVILDSIEHDRTILTFRGCASDLRFKELKLQKLRTKWFYFSSLTDEGYRTLEHLAAWAKGKGIKVAFNPSSYLTAEGFPSLRKLLESTDLLVLNRDEAKDLVKSNDIEVQLRMLQSVVPLVVITDGRNGVHTCNGESSYTCLPHKVRVVEATGAGDAFASAFLAGIIRNEDIETCIRMGMLNAESVITGLGAKDILLNKRQISLRLRQRPLRVTRKRLPQD